VGKIKMEQETEKETRPSKNYLLIFAVIVLVILGVYLLKNKLGVGPNTMQNQVQPSPSPSATPVSQPQVTDLKMEDLKVGTGAEVVSGKKVTVNYVGTLTDGTKFDSSYDHNVTFQFTIGAGEVIEGWDKGVVGMKVGGKRKLTIPASMGYGSQTVGTIPANSTLIFDIELLKVE
jgi:FKBP-type peptidyl-prolyl cis-trans isomerase